MSNNKKKILFLIVFLIFFTILVCSLYKILICKIDASKVEDLMLTINANRVNDEVISYDYLGKLKEENSDLVGWIKVNGTNIDYPIVQTTNNTYYLNRTFTKSYSTMGWIFMDYRNDSNFLDDNTIIYGHAGVENMMFNSLINLVTSSWLNNSDNYFITINTLEKELKYQIFSIYKIEPTNDYLVTNFTNNNFINMVLKRSDYNLGVGVSNDDKILTLSTCYFNNKNRLVVHAKLLEEA